MKLSQLIALCVFHIISSVGYIVQAQGDYGAETFIMPKIYSPSDIKLADIDGDDDLDIVICTLADHKVVWYENLGLGIFNPEYHLIANQLSYMRLGVADLDNDGDMDIVAGSYSTNKICLYLNNGTGYFSPPVTISDSFLTTTSICLYDLDGNGTIDIVATSSLGNKVSWFPNIGGGNFGSEQVLTTNVNNPIRLDVIDMNNDGLTDILVTGYSDSNIQLFLNIGSTTYSSALNVGTVYGIRDFTVYDLDNDGDLDIAVIYEISLGVNVIKTYRNNGAFVPLFYQGSFPISGVSPYSIEVADINSDGWADLFYSASNKIAWLPSSGGVSFGSDITVSTETYADNYREMCTSDLNSDGFLDIIAISQTDYSAFWFANNGSGIFSLPNYVVGLPDFSSREVQVIDIDGDWMKDVVSANTGSLAWFKNDGSPDFGVPNPVVILTGAVSFFAADLDNDGDNDIASVAQTNNNIMWNENDGLGNFSPPQIITTSIIGPNYITVADIDNNGTNDVLYSSSSEKKIAFNLNNGAGSFSAQQVIDTLCTGVIKVLATDINNDGYLDVIAGTVVSTTSTSTIYLYFNDGANNFSPPQFITSPSTGFRDMDMNDFNNDGYLDLCVVYTNKLVWYSNNGNGTFAPAQIIYIQLFNQGISIIDLDQNGTKDIVIANIYGQLLWFSHEGNGSFASPVFITPTMSNVRDFCFDDIDYDNDLDLFVARSYILSWFKNLGLAIQTYINNAPCVNASNGSISVFVTALQNAPYTYQWSLNGGADTGSGVADTDNFTIDNLAAGNYDITVTNAAGSAAYTSIILDAVQGNVFEVQGIVTTNSSNSLPNGSIQITLSGGQPPYLFQWEGLVSGTGEADDSTYTLTNLFAGTYDISITDATNSLIQYTVSLLDETTPPNTCSSPLDIVILNDASGSVDVIEYEEAKLFFVDLINALNIGMADSQSRVAVIEWSHDTTEVRIPMTGNLSELQDYVSYNRLFEGGTNPNAALTYGKDYLSGVLRPFATPILILSTDAFSYQISSSLIALADVYKAQGYVIITIAFDDAFSNDYTRNILTQTASLPLLAPGAPAYSLLDNTLANNIVNLYVCPSDPGSSNSYYFSRDGAITLTDITPIGDCPNPNGVTITYTVAAQQQLALPAGTPVTFYFNNPAMFSSTPILTTLIPCAIPAGESETFTITLPVTTPANIWAVLNDNGSQYPPVSFPITDISESIYSNNIADISVCTGDYPVLSAHLYTTTPQPVCGNTVFYVADVCNIGNADAVDVVVANQVPAGFVLVAENPFLNNCATQSINAAGSYLIPAGCCLSIVYQYEVSGAGNGFYNDQDVLLWGPSGQTYLNFDGATTSSEDVTVNGDINCPSDIVLFEKSVSVTDICEEGFLTYTFSIHNQTNVALLGVQFADILPPPCIWAAEPYQLSGLSIGQTTIAGTQSAVFNIAYIQPNTVATFSLDVYLNNWANTGSLSNTATLAGLPVFANGNGAALAAQSPDVAVTALPVILTQPNVYITSCQQAQLTATVTGSESINWVSAGDGYFTNPHAPQTTYIPGSADTIQGIIPISITVLNDCGETGRTIHLHIDPPPVCNDFDCSTTDTLNAETCLCEFTSVPLPDCDDNNDLTTDTYNLQNCVCEHTQTLPVMLLPNAFSPNGDNGNDFFQAVSNYAVTEFYLAVYNRWGQKVFESTDIDQSWNGTYQDRQAPIGVYVWFVNYRFTGDVQPREAKGNVTLIR